MKEYYFSARMPISEIKAKPQCGQDMAKELNKFDDIAMLNLKKTVELQIASVIQMGKINLEDFEEIELGIILKKKA